MTTKSEKEQNRIQAFVDGLGSRFTYGDTSISRSIAEESHLFAGHSLRHTFWDTKCNECEFNVDLMVCDAKDQIIDRYAISIRISRDIMFLIVDPTD